MPQIQGRRPITIGINVSRTNLSIKLLCFWLILMALVLKLGAPQEGFAAYPPDPPENFDWSCGTTGVTDIACAFNAAREYEETELKIILPDITLPSQVQWDLMEAGARALWLINEERTDRGLDPLHGLESNVMEVAQYYADYLMAHDAFGHTEDGRSPWQRLNDNPEIGACHDFLSVAENLAYLVTTGTSIPMPVEQSVYMWIYRDAGSSWGHRHAILYDPYNDNGGLADTEGFLGIGQASGPYMGWNWGEVVVMNVFDPCAAWNYAPEVVTRAAIDLLHEPGGTAEVTLNGQINPRGTPATAYFEYWKESSPGSVYSTTVVDAGRDLIPLPVSSFVNGLDVDTIYQFRLVGDNGIDLYGGGVLTFLTTIVYVDCEDNNDCGDDCFVPCYDPHIQDAVDAASSGATIKVAQGYYTEDGPSPYANVYLHVDAILELGLTSSYQSACTTATVIEPGNPGAPTLMISSGKVILWGGVELR